MYEATGLLSAVTVYHPRPAIRETSGQSFHLGFSYCDQIFRVVLRRV